MDFISAKCTSCGARIEAANLREEWMCPYCGTLYLKNWNLSNTDWYLPEKSRFVSKKHHASYTMMYYKGDDRYRYILYTEGVNPLVCIGLCPATADEHNADNTTKKVMAYAKEQGYDGIIMLNLFPLRYKYFDSLNNENPNELLQENVTCIRTLLKILNDSRSNLSDKKVRIWAAWGEKFENWPFYKKCLTEIDKSLDGLNFEWVVAGPNGALTATGHPRMPTMMSYDWDFRSFNVKRYLATR